MKTLVISILCIGLCCVTACNRNTTGVDKQPAFTDMQYIVTLQEGYNMKDLRSLLGSKLSKVGPSSKSQNVYLLTLNEAMSVDDLIEFAIIEDVVKPSQELEKQTTTHSTQKGTSTPIKKPN